MAKENKEKKSKWADLDKQMSAIEHKMDDATDDAISNSFDDSREDETDKYLSDLYAKRNKEKAEKEVKN